MGCDKCGTPMPLVSIIEGKQPRPLKVFECSACARGIIIEDVAAA